IYVGFKDETNARNFSGLNFNESQLHKAVEYIHQRRSQNNLDKHTKLFIAINTYPCSEDLSRWQRAIDMAAEAQVDAVILADIGLMDYTTNRYPHLNIHISVQASSTNLAALEFYHQNFNARRV